ncbi:unnamed protein product, partial [Mycena citricolor]
TSAHMEPSSLPALSRTLSLASTATSSSSEDLYAFINESTEITRRTRKRFTNAQLTMLEQLFHQNSHPSREQRETVAKSANMEVKSVTIWFQNKRQTERRTTLANGRVPPPVIINTHAPYPCPLPSPVTSPSMSSSASSISSYSSTSVSRRPSLDSVASRSELRAPAPRTPSRRHNPRAPLWENMPSSPVGPDFSPPAREFVEFGHERKHERRRTLEWACARSRMAEKGDPEQLPKLSHDEDTDVELDEAVTPPSTWGGGDARWNEKGKQKIGIQSAEVTATPKAQTSTSVDEDTMKAAIALSLLMRG